MKPKENRNRKRKTIPDSTRTDGPSCGLCGKTEKLVKTPCCDNWICDDEDQYVMFSYARNSCSRNHRRYTLCGVHYNEQHEGHWKDCPQCREVIETEMYVYYGTNKYNFEKLKNPPKYQPTRCSKCNSIIVLSKGGYSVSSEGYLCIKCFNPHKPSFLGRRRSSRK